MEKERKEQERRMVAQGLQTSKDRAEKDKETYEQSREEMSKREQAEKEKQAEFQAQSARDAALRAQQQPGNVAAPEGSSASAAEQTPAAKKQMAGGISQTPSGIFPFAAVRAMNEQAGGTNAPLNKFNVPSTEGIVFGGA
jgi:hypothetical protein